MEIFALILLIVGALNWGLVGLFQFDVIAAIFGGSAAIVSRVLYVAVALAGIWALTFFGKLMRRRDERASEQ